MANAGTVNIKLAAQTGSFEAGMKKVNGLLGGLTTSLNVVKGIAVGFLAWKATGFIRQEMAAIDATAKLADRLGMGTEALVGLQHAGNLAGVSVEGMATSMEKMGKNLADVGRPTMEVTDALKKMGLSFADMAAKSPDEKLNAIADGLNDVAGAGERSKIALTIFGKSGAGMVNVLADGSAGLAKMRAEADALGLTFDRIDAFKVEQANDALSRVGALFSGGFRTAAIEIAPIIEAISTRFIAAASNAGGMGKIVMSVLDTIQGAVGVLGDSWNVLLAAWHAGNVAVNMIGMAFAKTGDAAMRAIQFMGGLWSNWVKLVQDSTNLMVSTFSFLWANAKKPIADFVEFSGRQLSDLLLQSADATMRLKGSLSTELRAAAGQIRASVGRSSADASLAVAEAAAAMKKSGDDVKLSWKNLFAVETTGSPMMQQLAQGFLAAGEQSAASFSQSFTAVLDQEASTTVADWFAQIDALSEASAVASADRVAARLEIDRAAGEEQLAMADSRESYLTEMFGNQAEKRLAFEKQTLSQRLKYAEGIFGNLATLQNSTSKRMFAIGKIAAYAQAVVSTAAGIARQFADLPIYAAIPAAIAVAAAGIVQIQSISSTSFGGGGSVSSSGGSIPLVNGEPSGTQMAASGVTGNQVTTLRVSLDGLSDDAVLSGSQVRRLIEQINEGQRDGSRLEVSAA